MSRDLKFGTDIAYGRRYKATRIKTRVRITTIVLLLAPGEMMKWQEVIEFRSIDNQEMIRALDLESHITDLKPGNRPLQIHLFRHLTLKTDFCLHLVFNSDDYF